MVLNQLVFAWIATQAVTQAPLQQPRLRVIELDPAAKMHQETVIGAPHMSIEIRLPEPWTGELECANCSTIPSAEERDKAGQSAAHWLLKPQSGEDPQTFYLTMLRMPSRSDPVIAFQANMHLTLESGFALAIRLQASPPTKAHDSKVHFILPNQSLQKTFRERLRSELERKAKERTEQGALEIFTRYLFGKRNCTKTWQAPHQEDQLYVRVLEICSIEGPARTAYVLFELENMGRSPVQIAEVALNAHPSGVVEHNVWRQIDSKPLGFGKRALTMAVSTLGEGESWPAEWLLVVTEEGGRNRSVTVPGLSP